MKITTDITPRKDGTVIAVANGNKYVLEAGADGRPVVDVSNELDVGYLIDSGNFYPVDEADIDQGIAAVAQQQVAVASPEINPAIAGKRARK